MSDQVQIVYLDSHTLNPGDLSWESIEKWGQLHKYPFTPKNKILERCQGADIILTNKTILDAEIIEALPQLKCIGVTATGYNNVDLQAARKRGIPVCNAVGYSTPAVAQHVFALLLALTNRVETYNQSVNQGEWAGQVHFSYWFDALDELYGKKMGIYGFGRIGQAVAKIALAFGMKVLAHHKHPERDAMEGVEFVSLSDLFKDSDVVSLHAPLSKDNFQIVNKDLLPQMKPTAYLINTGRGDLIHEKDLSEALNQQQIAGAGLDVLSKEPPAADHPLIGIKNCVITPHQAWASLAARKRLLHIVAENIEAFLKGSPQNVVN